VPGIVGWLPAKVDIGYRIKAGEELVKLDVPDLMSQKKHKEALLEQAQKQVSLARESQKVAAREVEEAEKQEKRYAAEYAFAKVQNERVSTLVRQNTVTVERGQETLRQLEVAESAWQAVRASIDTKKARLAASAVDIEVAQSRVEVARAEVNNVSEMIGLATVRAPFDGYITKLWISRGSPIKDAGAPLLTVMNSDTVRILLDIPEKHVPLVTALENQPSQPEKPDPVELRVLALRGESNGGVFPGTVTRVSAALDPITRTMRTEVHLPNKEGHLKPNMYGTARITLAERPYVLTVPSAALARRADEVGVYIVADIDSTTQLGVVRWVKVQLGLDDGIQVEIRKGLQGNEAVIAKGNGVVREGDTVKAVPLRKAE